MVKQLKKFVVPVLMVGMLATSVLDASAGGTRETFDPVRYAKMYPDVVKELGTDPEKLWQHHEMFGRYEAREAYEGDTEAKLRRLFDVEDYAKFYPDVKEAFGDNKEAMFKHYIAFGLLEARRPSVEVSQAAAKELKKTVEKAMTDAGIQAVPGSLEVVKVLTGDTKTDVTTKDAAQNAEALALQTALTQVAEVVEKAVTETVAEVNHPTPAPAPAEKPSSSSDSSTGTPDSPDDSTEDPDSPDDSTEDPDSPDDPTGTPDSPDDPTENPDSPDDTDNSDVTWVTVGDSTALMNAVKNQSRNIKLTADITLNSRLDITYSMTLNLGGKTLSVNGEDEGTSIVLPDGVYGRGCVPVVAVKAEGVTIENGAITHMESHDWLDDGYGYGDGVYVDDGAGLTLNANVKAGCFGIIVGSRTDVTIGDKATVETMEDKDYSIAVYFFGSNGKATIGGTLIGATGMCVGGESDNNEIIIDGATIRSNDGMGVNLHGDSNYVIKNSTVSRSEYNDKMGNGGVYISRGNLSISKTSIDGFYGCSGIIIEPEEDNKNLTVFVNEDVVIRTEGDYAVTINNNDGRNVEATINCNLGGKKIAKYGDCILKGTAAVAGNIVEINLLGF